MNWGSEHYRESVHSLQFDGTAPQAWPSELYTHPHMRGSIGSSL
jgi:hypothetical protein